MSTGNAVKDNYDLLKEMLSKKYKLTRRSKLNEEQTKLIKQYIKKCNEIKALEKQIEEEEHKIDEEEADIRDYLDGKHTHKNKNGTLTNGYNINNMDKEDKRELRERLMNDIDHSKLDKVIANLELRGMDQQHIFLSLIYNDVVLQVNT